MLVAIAAEASEVLSREKSWTGFAEGTARGESKEQTTIWKPAQSIRITCNCIGEDSLQE